jgi:hypothetical protein
VTTGREWIDAYADALGTPRPDDGEVDALLALAGVAAHASERVAAPLCTWLAGRSGVDPERAKQVAIDLAAGLRGTVADGGSTT